MGTFIAPGIGTVIGSGLGGFAGGLASGEKPGQALLGGAESAGLAFAGGEALGAVSGGSLGFSDLSNAFGGSGTAPAIFGGGTSATPGVDFSSGGGSVPGISSGAPDSFLPTTGVGIGSATVTPSAPVGSVGTTTGALSTAAPTPGPATPAVAPGATAGPGASALAGPPAGGVGAGSPATPLPTTLGGVSPASSIGPQGDVGPTGVPGPIGPVTGTGTMDGTIFGAQDFSGMGGGDLLAGGMGSGGPTPGGGWAAGAGPSAVPAGASAGGLGGVASSVGDWLLANPTLALGGGLLAVEGLMNSGTPPGLPRVSQEAKNLTGLSNQALSSLQTGNIPGGAQAALNQAQSASEAQIRSQFAALGLSGSTMEAQALAQVPQQIAAQKWNIIQGLVNTGLQEANMASSLDVTRMNALIAQDQQFQNAISNFAAALAGGAAIHGITG